MLPHSQIVAEMSERWSIIDNGRTTSRMGVCNEIGIVPLHMAQIHDMNRDVRLVLVHQPRSVSDRRSLARSRSPTLNLPTDSEQVLRSILHSDGGNKSLFLPRQ